VFGENVLAFWSKLALQGGEVLLDEYLMGHLLRWLELLGSWEHRPFRHVATAVGLHLLTPLVKLHNKAKVSLLGSLVVFFFLIQILFEGRQGQAVCRTDRQSFQHLVCVAISRRFS
jgi:hypothetical protein